MNLLWNEHQVLALNIIKIIVGPLIGGRTFIIAFKFEQFIF